MNFNRNTVCQSQPGCKAINFRVRQRAEEKALLLWRSKSLKAVRDRFSKCLRDPAMSVGPNVGFSVRDTTLTATVGLRMLKNLQYKMRTGEKNYFSPTSKHSALGKVYMQSRGEECKPPLLAKDQHQQHHQQCQKKKRKDSVWTPSSLETPSYSQRSRRKETASVFLL